MEETSSFQTFLVKAVKSVDLGHYGRIQVRDINGKTFYMFRFNLTKEEEAQLVKNFHFVRVTVKNDKYYFDKMVPCQFTIAHKLADQAWRRKHGKKIL